MPDRPYRRHETLGVAAWLLVLSAVAFAPWFGPFGLVHDDWPLVLDMAQGKAPLGGLDGLRPGLGIPWRLCGLAFGQWLPGYYAVLFALQWLAAVLLFVLARPYATAGFAAAFATLTLVYPADASHLWLGTLTQRSAWLLAVAALVLGDRARARALLIVPAVALAFASLALYELQLPLLVAWPLVAALLGSRWRRAALLAWALIPVLYLGWRFVARPMLGDSIAATASFQWSPVWIAQRAFVLVPYNLFADGWWIALRQTVATPLLAVIAFAAVAACAVPTAAKWASGPGPSMRIALLALGLIALGMAPILPTTYWLGRTSGTYGARILSAALPGAALLVLLFGARMLRSPRGRGLALSGVLALAFAFHWNAAVAASENWTIQQSLHRRLRATASAWPKGSFLVIVDMPPNRLSFDTPFGVGRLIRETYGDDSLSGIGICQGRAVRDVLSPIGSDVLVMGGAYGFVAQARLIPLRWRDEASLERLPESMLARSLRPGGGS